MKKLPTHLAGLLASMLGTTAMGGLEDTPLHKAAQANDLQQIQALLDVNANPAALGEGGYTPLHSAAKNGSAEAIAQLANQMSVEEVNIQGYDGDTALYYAALNGTPEAVDTLLAYGADPTIANEKGYTPLHMAAYSGAAQIIKRLLKIPEVAELINLQGVDGDTPLYYAARSGSLEAVEALLDRDALETTADPRILNKQGETARSIADELGFDNIVARIDEEYTLMDEQEEVE